MARRIRSINVYLLHLYDAASLAPARYVGTSVFAHLTEVAAAIRTWRPAPGYATLGRRVRDGAPFRLARWVARIERVGFNKLQIPVLSVES